MLGKHPANWAISLVLSIVVLEYQSYYPKEAGGYLPSLNPLFSQSLLLDEHFVKQDFLLLILSLRHVTESRPKLNIWTKQYLLLLVISKNILGKQIKTFWGNKLAPGNSTELAIECSQI